MKGYRFYLEYDSTYKKRKGQHSGNVFAVALRADGHFLLHLDSRPSGDCWAVEGLSATFFHPNSDVSWGSADLEWYIQKRCKRISEAKAREIHPALFERLDNAEEYNQ